MVLYLTDGCNSKCAMCDIWQVPRRNIDLSLVEQLAISGRKLGTKMVLLSGGEAMQHPEWPTIAQMFRNQGIQVWLLTNGLLLRKQATAVVEHIDLLTVSLDAATSELYHKIRGVDAFDLVLDGMQHVSANGIRLTTRTTIMRANFHQMPQIIDVALAHGAQSVRFLAVDTVNPYAFGPRTPNSSTNGFGALAEDDLPALATILDKLEQSHANYFANDRIAESPAKLHRILYDFFAAPYGKAEFKPPRCNAPNISVVVNVDGSLQPCYFLPSWGKLTDATLETALNDPAAIKLRQAYRRGDRPECARCVCPLYRGPRAIIQDL